MYHKDCILMPNTFAGYARDATGKWQVIVQTESLPQRVAIDLCHSPEKPCKKTQQFWSQNLRQLSFLMCKLNRFQTQHVILWIFIRSNDVRLWQKISMYTAIYVSAFTCSGSWQLTWLSNNPCLQIPSSLRLPYWIPWLPLWILLNEEKQI